MGWGAAQAFYEENSSWLDSPEDAYDALYGDDRMSNGAKRRCPICGKKSRHSDGVIQHMKAVHTAKKFAPRIAEFIEKIGDEAAVAPEGETP